MKILLPSCWNTKIRWKKKQCISFSSHAVYTFFMRAGHPLKPSSLCTLWLSVGFFECRSSTPPMRTPEKLGNLHNKLLLEECAVIFNDCNIHCEHSPSWIQLVEEAGLKLCFSCSLSRSTPRQPWIEYSWICSFILSTFLFFLFLKEVKEQKRHLCAQVFQTDSSIILFPICSPQIIFYHEKMLKIHCLLHGG